jgi:hypothetical protein
MLEVLASVNVDVEVLASIHGKAVNDNLTKHAVVLPGLDKGLEGTETPATAEIAIDGPKTGTEQAWGYDKDVGEEVDGPDVYDLQQPDKPLVHQTIAVCGAFPLLFCHTRAYPTLLSI